MRVRNLLATGAIVTLAVPVFAAAGATAGTNNPKACFGQDRAAGVHSIGGSTWGDIASDRAGDNAAQNEAYRNTCS